MEVTGKEGSVCQSYVFSQIAQEEKRRATEGDGTGPWVKDLQIVIQLEQSVVLQDSL